MTSPDPRSRRERLVALFVLGVAVVLVLSTPTWFGSDRAGVGTAQLVAGVVLAGVGAFLLRRARPR
ncbi:hypothetical protein GCU67_05725 [Modestobacter muralis]|uniref:LPXTG cell wall anchor domain-containing protein n=1 Tax=Modestobacter muralis TaxID=1608614 RepID=A0A6P0H5P4_9ACTN|nr:hypothetical protein [Modestobacter muralis]NEK93676.1 hypothetical protein [Modestobacter muralis]NEN50443.1 hypothetical protein [Modestobacter muralis]